MLKQESVVRFASEDRKIIVLCEGDTPLGVLHDFLMGLKGSIVTRMVDAQSQEEQSAQQQAEPAVPAEPASA